METLVKAYNICVTLVAQGHRHQLSIPPIGRYASLQHISVNIRDDANMMSVHCGEGRWESAKF